MYLKGFGRYVTFNKVNIGCGYDTINEESWLNVDKESRGPAENVRIWDVTSMAPDNVAPDYDYVERFEFALVNHVLCTMNEWQAHKALINIHRSLKPGGKVQIIDMDLLKVFAAYNEDRIEDIPIEEGDIDDRLTRAISGYGTRLSLYTPRRMETVLYEAGFRFVSQLDKSEYDTRPKESLIFEAAK